MKVEFFKKSYFILTKNFHQRFIKAYDNNQFSGFCSKEGHGYIKYIQYNFNLKYPPTIINLSDRRVKLPYWIFKQNKHKIKNDKIILINFELDKNFDFNNYLVKDNFNKRCFFLIRK